MSLRQGLADLQDAMLDSAHSRWFSEPLSNVAREVRAAESAGMWGAEGRLKSLMLFSHLHPVQAHSL